MNWLPIESAPKDAPILLLYKDDKDQLLHVCQGRWVDGLDRWKWYASRQRAYPIRNESGWQTAYVNVEQMLSDYPALWQPLSRAVNPTHWQPLPAPPKHPSP